MTLSPSSTIFDVSWKGWLPKIGMFLMPMCVLLQGVTVWAAEVIGASGPRYLFQVESADGKREKANKMKQFFHRPLRLHDKICILEPENEEVLLVKKDYSDKLQLEVQLNDKTVQKVPEKGDEYKNGKTFYTGSCLVDNGDEPRKKSCYCYEVKESPPPPSSTPGEIVIGVLSRVLDVLSNERDAKVILVSQGEQKGDGVKVEIPMLGTDSIPTKLVAGRKTLYLAWEGSQSAYWVHIYQDGTPLRKEGFVVDKPEIVLSDKKDGKDFPSLSVGQKYKVEVRGKENGSVLAEGVFTVVAGLEAILPCEAIKKVEDIKSTDKETLVTTLLLQNGAWLEAHQRVENGEENSFTAPFRLFLTDKQVRDHVLNKE